MAKFFSKRRLKIAEQIIIVIFFAVIIPMTISGFVINNINQQSNRAQLKDAAIMIANVVSEEMPLEEAKKSGAIGLFENKYGDTVKVYTIGDFSKEICGGPHVKHTGELGHFKIKKEESSSAGIRRIKAILE